MSDKHDELDGGRGNQSAELDAPEDHGNLAWKTALVTGGASGLGEALVHALTARGASVLAVDLNEEGLARVAAATGCSTMFADVSSRAANIAAAARCVDRFGGLDMSFLNAGALDRRPEDPGPDRINDLDFERYDFVRGVLLDAVIHGSAAAADAMDGNGSIVVTSGVAGLAPWPRSPVYSAMKHGVVGWVRTIAPTLARDGVRISAMCPAVIDTPTRSENNVRIERPTALLGASEVADAMIELALADSTGDAWSMVAHRDPVLQLHEFTPVPGYQ